MVDAVSQSEPPTSGSVQKTRWTPEYIPLELSDRWKEPPVVRTAREAAWEAFVSLPAEKDPLYKKYAHLGNVDLSRTGVPTAGTPIALPDPRPYEIVLLHDATGTRSRASKELDGARVEVLSREELTKKGGPVLTEFLTSGDPLSEKFHAMNLALSTHWTRIQVADGFEHPVRVRDIAILTEPDQLISVKRQILAGRMTRVFHTEEVYVRSALATPRLYSSDTTLNAGADSEVIAWSGHAPDSATVAFYNRTLSTAENAHVYWLFAGMDGYRTTVRNFSKLERRGAEVTDLQVYFADSDQSCASSIRVLHDADDTRGQSIARGVFKDSARGTLTGMMRIDPSVKKIYSYLSEHAMLLSKTARAETAPGMEIHSSNDVKAAHSSSVAPLDPERVFYIESRGFPEALAVRFIVDGFLSSVLSKSPLEGVDTVLTGLLDARWGGQHPTWNGRGWSQDLNPGTAIWKTSGEERFDEKLRGA